MSATGIIPLPSSAPVLADVAMPTPGHGTTETSNISRISTSTRRPDAWITRPATDSTRLQVDWLSWPWRCDYKLMSHSISKFVFFLNWLIHSCSMPKVDYCSTHVHTTCVHTLNVMALNHSGPAWLQWAIFCQMKKKIHTQKREVSLTIFHMSGEK